MTHLERELHFFKCTKTQFKVLIRFFEKIYASPATLLLNQLPFFLNERKTQACIFLRFGDEEENQRGKKKKIWGKYNF